jgi:hypothetical protein
MRRAGHHLTYCLNIHRGETWAEHFAAIRGPACAVRDRVAPGEPFGLGLRLGAAAAEELARPEARREFKDFLARENLYVFTINGFPYGAFHGVRVKEQVYAPDWRSPARLDYTLVLAKILAQLLPEGVDGSISTAPLSFKPWMATPADLDACLENLAALAGWLAVLEQETGRTVRLALEPEPACTLETTPEVLRFFEEDLFGPGAERLARRRAIPVRAARELLRKFIGVCLDTCHAAVQFEDPADAWRRLRAAGIGVPKVQISAALAAAWTDAAGREAARAALAPFVEPVYFHQVRAAAADGAVTGWTDLPEALDGLARRDDLVAARCHFHVPLFWSGTPPLTSTAADLGPAFFAEVRADPQVHLEIETYTFDVLPPPLRAGGVVDGIVREFARVGGWLG